MPSADAKKRRSKGYYNVGVQGRATGVQVKASRRDSDYLAAVGDFFDSDESDDSAEGDEFDDAVDGVENEAPLSANDGDDAALPTPASAASTLKPASSARGARSTVRKSGRKSTAKKTPPTATPIKKIDFAAEPQDTPEFVSYSADSPAIDEDDDDDDDAADDEVSPPKPSTAKKGKGRAAGKGGKAKAKAAASGKKKAAPRRKALADMPTVAHTPSYTETDDGVRRSRRNRLTPCAYWKNERVVYEQAGGGVFKAAGKIKPETPATPYRTTKRKRPSAGAGKTRKTSRGGGGGTMARIDEEGDDDDDDDGDDGEGDEAASAGDVVGPVPVLNWRTEGGEDPEPFELMVAKTRAMLELKDVPRKKGAGPADAAALRMCKAFNVSEERWAAGMLEVAPRGEKPKQYTKSNFLVFFVASAAVEATIHESTLTMPKGSMFFVPPGNYYSLHNPTGRPCKLSFMQIKV